MRYLLNPKKRKSAVHYWADGDTFCRMYSTGGMRKALYKVFPENPRKQVCVMCESVYLATLEIKE